MVDKRKLKKSLYTAAQWTWGLPQTLAGAGLYLRHRKDPHFDYNGAKVTAWDGDSGVSLGKFIFVPAEKRRQGGSGDSKNVASEKDSEKPAKVNSFLLEHEYGHTIQSLLLGPAYLFLVGLTGRGKRQESHITLRSSRGLRASSEAGLRREAVKCGRRKRKRRTEIK